MKEEKSLKNGGIKLLVIHNFRGIKTIDDLNLAIDRDILKVFNATKETCSQTQGVFYSSKKILHYIIAEEGSVVGNIYNSKTYEMIKSAI